MSLVHFPAIFKQEAAFLFGNLRDGPEESMRQLDYVQAKVVFSESRLLDAYEPLRRCGCTVVAMDHEPGLPPDVLCFWDLVGAASDADNDVELNFREDISLLRFVYAVEVEAALSEHPAVLMSAVVGIPHPDWGEAVHAEIILREGTAADTEELVDFVKARLGSYKAPKSIVFVGELPLSAVGKVLRRRVRERYWADQNRRI